jgi:hypothetical protein
VYAIDEVGYRHIDGYFPAFEWMLIAVHGRMGMKFKWAMQLSNAKLQDLKSLLPYNPSIGRELISD